MSVGKRESRRRCEQPRPGAQLYTPMAEGKSRQPRQLGVAGLDGGKLRQHNRVALGCKAALEL